jgi:predicted DCC family thiol-disulfide oxidoreductase YuxK
MIRSRSSAGTEMPIILFDGVCNLCESTVHFVVRRDKNRQFRFASLQSAAAQEILSSHQYAFDDLSSVLLIVDDTLYKKSRAALKIVRRLDGAWPIGNRRYKWFGKKTECWIPNDDLRQRFIDDPTGRE